jgi:hypothetical protein
MMKLYLSLTSIYQNQKILVKTLQSLVKQSRCPDEIFLFLSDTPYLLDHGFPKREGDFIPELVNLLNTNTIVKVIWVENTGPYRKLLPLLEKYWNEDCLIITLDDDTVYHPQLIENYEKDYNIYKCCISYRGYTMDIECGIIGYDKRLSNQIQNLYNFSTGKGGVVYHPKFFHKHGRLILNDKDGIEFAKTNDDIWFNFIRIACGIQLIIKDTPWIMYDLTDSSVALFSNFNLKNNTKMMKDVYFHLLNKGVDIFDGRKMI